MPRLAADYSESFSLRLWLSSLLQRTGHAGLALRAYFRSGWAFLIPYLASYLLYASTGWPVNPVSGDGPHAYVRSISLLHIYWILHAVNAGLGVIALRSWWLEHKTTPATRSRSATSVVPWLCLAAIFWIPGFYLEWPSDPWEHLRRINEWHIHSQVTDHSTWKKSSYFLPYSLTRHTTGLTQLSCLNLYYTGICLLLCWQYYRLARAMGLSERPALIFVLLQALLSGNSIFSFYRYYGLSSSIFAQIGAIALTRTALEVASSTTLSLTASFYHPRPKPKDRGRSSIGAFTIGSRPQSAWLLASCSILVLFTAFNHQQGVGIAGIGLLGVIVWRLIEWRRSIIFWLAGTAVILSVATVLWFPHHPALDEVYRANGWLTWWYGFNLFSFDSPAFERSLHILGIFGVLSVVVGVWLVARKNHIAGWLTLMPLLALVLPCFALPLAHALASEKSVEHITTFHRMLLAVPTGIALVALGESFSRAKAAHKIRHLEANNSELENHGPRPRIRARQLWPLACSISLLLVVTFAPGASAYNRFWHSMQITPDDLRLGHFVAAWTPENLSLATNDSTLTISSPVGGQIQEVFAPLPRWTRRRQTDAPLNFWEIERSLHWLDTLPTQSAQVECFPTEHSWTDIMVIDYRDMESSTPRIVADLTTPGFSWVGLRGMAPEDIESADQRLLISNPAGGGSHAFAANLIRIDRSKRYYAVTTIKHLAGPPSTSYLAVAWYDKDRRFLPSYQPQPTGANTPRGWSNGVYSYYGLRGGTASNEWTTYGTAFGLGEEAVIPANAAFIRLGAILNYKNTPESIVQIKDVALWQKPDHSHVFIVLPSPFNLFSSFSPAALLSRHWTIQNTQQQHAGLVESRSLASKYRPGVDVPPPSLYRD